MQVFIIRLALRWRGKISSSRSEEKPQHNHFPTIGSAVSGSLAGPFGRGRERGRRRGRLVGGGRARFSRSGPVEALSKHGRLQAICRDCSGKNRPTAIHAINRRPPGAEGSRTDMSKARSSPHPSALFRPCLRSSERVPARSVPSKPPPATGGALHFFPALSCAQNLPPLSEGYLSISCYLECCMDNKVVMKHVMFSMDDRTRTCHVSPRTLRTSRVHVDSRVSSGVPTALLALCGGRSVGAH